MNTYRCSRCFIRRSIVCVHQSLSRADCDYGNDLQLYNMTFTLRSREVDNQFAEMTFIICSKLKYLHIDLVSVVL